MYKYKVGNKVFVISFCNVSFPATITRLDEDGGYWVRPLNKQTLYKLQSAGVPFNPDKDWPDNCDSYAFPYHVKPFRKKRKR